MVTWLLSMSYMVAPIRLAEAAPAPGGRPSSLLATMYQHGFVFHATPVALC